MLIYLILLFTIVPVIELAVLLRVGQFIGVMNTVSLVIFTGVAGAMLTRSQGLRAFLKMQEEISAGRIPGDFMFDGLFILCGGILLLTPGFITDSVGLLMLLPFTRGLFKRWLAYKIRQSVEKGNAETFITWRKF